MLKELKMFHCSKCKQLLEVLDGSNCIPQCCGEEMEELVANTTDAATEKHVPVIKRSEGKIIVKVGSTTHPMTPEHLIEHIILVTGEGIQRVSLTPSDEPKAEFIDVPGPIAAYEFCNLHGLWKAEA